MTCLNDRTVLVTGAGGFLGSHLVENLLERGARIRALVRYQSEGHLGQLRHCIGDERLAVVRGDVRDRDRLTPLVEDVDTVFHLAANVSVPHSFEDPVSHVMTNAVGTLHLLQALRRVRPRRIVVVSSSEVYGSAQSPRIDENHPLVAQSPYAASKIAAEKLCESFHRTYGLPIVVVRPFNLFGPRQTRRAVIPSIVSQALAGQRLRLGRIDTYRDFNYVLDTVHALVSLSTVDGVDGRVFNIGTGTSTAISEVIEMVFEILGYRVPVNCDEELVRPERSEVIRLCANSDRLHAAIGEWRRTTLTDGLRSVVSYHRQVRDEGPVPA